VPVDELRKRAARGAAAAAAAAQDEPKRGAPRE